MEDMANARGRITREQAEEQIPEVDPSAPAASEETPEGANEVVFAQTPEEVQAQIDNPAGGYGEDHEADEAPEDQGDED